MQACEVCGWDTREGTRVCPSCRAQQQAPDAAEPGVLAGVLRTVRDMSTDADDAERPTPAGQPTSTTSRRPRGPRPADDDSEQVVLREIEPGGDDQPRPAAASSVAASLLAAFQAKHDPTTPAAPSSHPDDRPATAIEGDVPAPAEVGTGVDAPPGAAAPPIGDRVEAIDVTDRLRALDRPPAGDEVDDNQSIRARSADETDTAGIAAPLPNARPGADAATRTWGPDDSGPITDRFANIPTVPMEPGPASEPSVGGPADDITATDVSVPVPVDAIGDTTVPPAPVREDPAADTPIAQEAAPSAQASAPSAQAGATADPSPPTADRTPAQGGTAQQQAPDAPAWRAALREAGTWTTVAQFTLLFMGMLCVFQVVVLLVVNQFLAQSPQTAAPDMLAAHAKVATVMLPALVGGAFATAAFAAWRAQTDPRERDDTSWLRRRLGGLPIAVWAVFVAATLVLLVVLLGTSATVAEARQMTWWAIGACSLLGVACVAAPRGLATHEADDGAEASVPGGERVSA